MQIKIIKSTYNRDIFECDELFRICVDSNHKINFYGKDGSVTSEQLPGDVDANNVLLQIKEAQARGQKSIFIFFRPDDTGVVICNADDPLVIGEKMEG